MHIKISTYEGTKEFEISFRQLNNLLVELLDSKTKVINIVPIKPIRKDQIIDIKVFVREDKKHSETLLDALWSN